MLNNTAKEDPVQTPKQPVQETKNLPEGVPSLQWLYLYISGSCNLTCRHCWITPTYNPNGKGGLYIDLSHVQKAICEAKPLGLTSVKLTGGEPTLHPQFRELVSLIRSEELSITMETNGTLIDDPLAEFLKQKNLRFVSVSMDGAKAKTHDYLRGVPGSYKSAINGIKALVEAGFSPQLICTLHRGNIPEIEELVRLAERLDCGSVKFNLLQSAGRGEKFAKRNGLDIPEMIQLSRWVQNELASRSQIRVIIDVPAAFETIRTLVTGFHGVCRVKNILGMLASGALSLCGIGFSIPELVYGHIDHDDLQEVWFSSPGLGALREQIPAQLEGICGQCLHTSVCQGSCVANNYHLFRRLGAPSAFCDRAEALGLFPASRKRHNGSHSIGETDD